MSIIKAQGTGEVSTGFYPFSIDQSLRYNSPDTLALKRTPSSAGNRQTWSISMWIKRGNLGIDAFLCEAGASGDADSRLRLVFNTSDKLLITTGNANLVTSTMVLRDVGSWYHILWRNTGGTNTCFVNGVQATTVSISGNTAINSTVQHGFGTRGASGAGDEFDGYIAQYALFDGTAYTYDQVTETKDGILVPKNLSTLSYGTNGFLLDFANSGAVGTDAVGSNNMDTVSGFVASDVVPDSPTQKWCTLNRNLPDSHFNTDQLSEGNLFYNEGEGNNGDGHPTATFSVTSGKWYWEVQVPSAQNNRAIGFTRTDNIGKGNVELHGAGLSAANSVVGIDLTDDTIDQVDKAGTHTQEASGLTGMANNDIFGISVDLDGGTFQMYRNGSAYGSSYNLDDLADWQTHGMTPTATGDTYMAYRFNFGQDSSFAGAETAQGNADSNGVGDFFHAVPSGFLALASNNLPEPTIVDGSTAFNTVLYTGTGSTQSITGVGFGSAPDWVWIKVRNNTNNHRLFDTVRGAGKDLISNSTSTESTTTTRLQSFDSDGFTVGSNAEVNSNGHNIVAWNWLAGTAFSNDASATGVGNVDSSGQVNTTAGFSIVSWQFTTSADNLIAHLLSSAPEMMIIKSRTTAYNWDVYHTGLSNPATKRILLNTTGAEINGFFDTNPTSTVFEYNTSALSNNDNAIAYCFHSVEGYSKVGSYIGNGNADGTYVHLGFRPVFILLRESGNARNWVISYDHSTYYNGVTQSLFPNISQAEDANTRLDFLSNGFKLRTTSTSWNNNSGNFIYYAIGDQPAKFSNAR